MQEERCLTRRGRTLERGPADADDGVPARERWKQVAYPLRPRDRVELVSALGEPRRRSEGVVGAERDDEHIGLVLTRIRRDATCFGIDGRDGLAEKAHARLRHRRVGKPHRFRLGVAEHDVELRIAEHESVPALDERHARVRPERLGETGRDLEAAEAGAEDEDALAHAASLAACQIVTTILPCGWPLPMCSSASASRSSG